MHEHPLPSEIEARGKLRAALLEYARTTELALSSSERRLAELTEAAAALLKRIEIAQCHLESMSWWDHVWIMLRRPTRAYRLWVEADQEADEAFGQLDLVLRDSVAPDPSERQAMRREIATAYGRIVDLLTVQRQSCRYVANTTIPEMGRGLDSPANRQVSRT
jgi:hypothetical protein